MASVSTANRDPITVAINNISDKRLREIFTFICRVVPEAREVAAEELLVDSSEKREEGASSSDASADEDSEQTQPQPQPTPAPAPASLKRPVPRYAFCSNCKVEFDVRTNSSSSCRFHPEDAEPTGEDLWVDNEFGVEDTPETREQYPDCFQFMCCGDTIAENLEGCEGGWHVEGEREEVVKRARWFEYQPSFDLF